MMKERVAKMKVIHTCITQQSSPVIRCRQVLAGQRLLQKPEEQNQNMYKIQRKHLICIEFSTASNENKIGHEN